MALKKFVGARYAPQFMGAWSQATQYAALSVVYADQRSYVSRKTVPAGTEITNSEFWIQSSDWNAQVAQYNQKVDAYNANVEQYNKNVKDYEAAVSTFYADTLHSYDTKADMQADKTLKVGETLLTCGDKGIGDGGGSFYQVVADTSATAVALDNGLFAEPFEFQPYDYSQFQTEVEGYKKSTTRVYQNVEAMVADANIDTGDTLMTNGRTVAGDGKGRFWTVSDEPTGNATRLNNGKYASPFQLASVDTANMLVFNGQGAQPAIWGIKEGGDPITVPVLLEEGDIKTVYVAVEYTTGGKGATVNLDVSGTQSFNTSFAFNESAPDEGTYKTVLYAITAKAEGGNVYTGYSTVTSYATKLTKYTSPITIGIPDNDNNPWIIQRIIGTAISVENINVTKNITLKSITINAKTAVKTSQFFATIYKYSTDTFDSSTATQIGHASIIPSNELASGTVNIDAEVNAGEKLCFFYTVNTTAGVLDAKFYTPLALTGNFGPFTLNKVAYSGFITYTPRD